MTTKAILCFALLCSANSIAAQTRSPAQTRLNESVPVWLKAFNVTGVGVAYIEDGKVSWTAFYGEQTPQGPKAIGSTRVNSD